MMFSVIIATRDRAALLRSTLAALIAQQSPGAPCEIIIVDNGSVDETPDVVTSGRQRSPHPVIYLRETRPGKSHALNTALEHAQGDLLVLTDDDVLPSPGWLAAYARAFAETEADFATGRILPLWEAPPPRWLSPALYGVLAIPDGGDERVMIAPGQNEAIMPLGANMAIRRHVVERVGGWNTRLGKLQGTLRTGEDHEFALRMTTAGFTGVYEPQALVEHRVPADRLRLGYFHRWFRDNGAIEAQLEEQYPFDGPHLFGVPRYRWRLLVRDLSSLLLGVATLDPRRATAGEMRAAWFAGYLRARWGRRGRRQERAEGRGRTARSSVQ